LPRPDARVPGRDEVRDVVQVVLVGGQPSDTGRPGVPPEDTWALRECDTSAWNRHGSKKFGPGVRIQYDVESGANDFPHMTPVGYAVVATAVKRTLLIP
jgi:hypothetical protein